ncbi:TPM domain-containing protein [Streptomyces sp. G45]|uniref:TPM domain-containing protein n=1 Tax=Streptomyces sp. G45 TaxID=3406627 RepID=UPI003C20DBB5
MTPTSPSRPSRTAARAVAAALLLGCWLPGGTPTAHAAPGGATAPVTRAQDDGVAGDLALPVVAVGAAAAFAAVAAVRRRRRFTTRTTPGGTGAPRVPLADLDAEARRLLVATDDAVRTSAEEVAFVTAASGTEGERAPSGSGDAVAAVAAVAAAREEVAAAFALRQRLDGFRGDDGTRRRLLDEITAHCSRAGRLLDAEAAAWDELRALEQRAPDAVERAERVFRQVNARALEADGMLKELRSRYAPAASDAVLGDVEQAKDRLVFATTRLNQARQALDTADPGRAAVHLRAAEGAVGQAGRLVDGVLRFAWEVGAADWRLPGALEAAEADAADARGAGGAGGARAERVERVERVEHVVAEVRRERDTESYDPVGALRRLVEAHAALAEALAEAGAGDEADGRARALLDQALLIARGDVAAADDRVATHRGAVGCAARTRLAEAGRWLREAEQRHAEADAAGSRAPGGGGRARLGAALDGARRAAESGRRARALAERDVRAYGNPSADGVPESGVGGAVLGGILVEGGVPAAFGGPRTRARLGEFGRRGARGTQGAYGVRGTQGAQGAQG